MATPEKGESGSSILRRFGPLVAVVLVAQLLIAWLVIEVVLVRAGAPEDDDDILPPARSTAAVVGEDRRLPYYYAPVAFQRIVANPANTNGQRFMLASLELGLKAYDRRKKPPKDDITAHLGQERAVVEIVDRYANKMRAIMADALARRGVDEFDRRDLLPIQEEIRQRINKEVLQPAFPLGTARYEVRVVEVLFTEMVIQ